jgi:hypothetical protein
MRSHSSSATMFAEVPGTRAAACRSSSIWPALSHRALFGLRQHLGEANPPRLRGYFPHACASIPTRFGPPAVWPPTSKPGSCIRCSALRALRLLALQLGLQVEMMLVLVLEILALQRPKARLEAFQNPARPDAGNTSTAESACSFSSRLN